MESRAPAGSPSSLQAYLENLRGEPDRPRAWLDCAQGLWDAGGDSRLVEECLKRALRREPGSVPARLMRAKLLWRASSMPFDGNAPPLWAVGRLTGAALALERALDGSDPPAGALEDSVAFFVETGEIDRAEAVLRRLVRRRPGSAAGHAALARIALWRGRARAAEESARRALALGSRPALSSLAGSLVLQGRFAPALRALGRLGRGGDEARLWRAEIHRLKGRERAARAELSRARGRPNVPPALELQKALLDLRAGPYRDPASRALARVLARSLGWLGGNRSDLPLLRSGGRLFRYPSRPFFAGDAYGSQRPDAVVTLACEQLLARIVFQRPEWVLAELKRLARRLPAEPQPLAHRGELLLWLGRYEEAREHFEAVSRMPGARIWWMVALGAVELLRGDARRALETLREAEARGALPRSVAPWRGECLRRLGEHRGAIAELQNARAMFPFHVSVWLNLALACRGLGRREDFSRLFHALRRQAPDLVGEAARAEGLDPARPKAAWEAEGMAGVLEGALGLMRGNRSAAFPTYVPSDGKLRVARLRGC